MNNTPAGPDTINYPLERDMRVFNTLPKSVRRALAGAWFSIGAESTKDAMRKNKIPAREVVKIIEASNVHYARNLGSLDPRVPTDINSGAGGRP